MADSSFDIDSDFYDAVEKYTKKESKRCESLQLRDNLMKAAIPKNTHKTNQMAYNLLFPPSVLREICTKQAVKSLLDCTCKICSALPGGKSQLRDNNLANGITADRVSERLLLFALLIYMGAGFAVREVCFTVVSGLDISALEEFLRKEFFPHLDNKGISLSDKDTTSRFLDVFKQARRVFNTPYFASRRGGTEKFIDMNLPFIGESRVGDSNLWRFKIHSEFCESELRGVNLIRKELEWKDRLDREGTTLNLLDPFQQPNLIKLLFWYRIDHKVNYVFRHYSYTLKGILDGGLSPSMDPPPANYQGSVLKHRLWQGLVDLVHSLSFLHQPRAYNDERPTYESYIIHFDIKPANIMVTNDCTLILADFGDAQIRLKGTPLGESYGGDVNYAPPPVNKEDYKDLSWGPSYDVWSIACVALQIIEFILAGSEKNASNVFQQSRGDGEATNLKFWTPDVSNPNIPGRRFKLHKRVEDKLQIWKRSDDKYLKTVALTLQKMLSIAFKDRPEMKVCHAMLSQTFLTDEWPLWDEGEESICGLGGKHQLRNMMTQFQRIGHGEPARCKLYMLRHQAKRVYRLAVEFEKQMEDGKSATCIISEPGSLDLEVYMPISLFQSDFLKNPEEAARCAFGIMHSNLRFIFGDVFEYYLFLIATTLQDPCILATSSRSIFAIPIQRCRIRYPGYSFSSGIEEFKEGGHVEVWNELSKKEHEERFINYSAPSPHTSRQGLTGRSNTHRGSAESASHRSLLGGLSHRRDLSENNIALPYRRLVVFLYETPSRCLTIILNNGKTKWGIERNDRRSDRHLLIKYVENNRFKMGELVAKDESPCPGIPVDPKVLRNMETVKVVWVELEFENASCATDFQNLYHNGMGVSTMP